MFCVWLSVCLMSVYMTFARKNFQFRCNLGCLLVLTSSYAKYIKFLITPGLVAIEFNKNRHRRPIHQICDALICKWKHIWENSCTHLWWILWLENVRYWIKKSGDRFGDSHQMVPPIDRQNTPTSMSWYLAESSCRLSHSPTPEGTAILE